MDQIFKTAKEICPPQYEAGKIVSDGKSFLKMACMDGYIHLLDVQLAGRKRMLIKDFLNGYHVITHSY